MRLNVTFVFKTTIKEDTNRKALCRVASFESKDLRLFQQAKDFAEDI